MNKALCKNSIILTFLAALVIFTVGGVCVYSYFQSLLRINADVIESYQTIRASNQSLISINEAALEVSTFLQTDNPEVIKNLSQIIISAQLNLANLKQLIGDDAKQTDLFNELKPNFDKKIEFLQNIISTYSTGKKQEALQIAADKNRLDLTNKIIQSIIEIKHLEAGQLEKSNLTFQKNTISTNYIFLIFGILSEILFLLSFVFLRMYLISDNNNINYK